MRFNISNEAVRKERFNRLGLGQTRLMPHPNSGCLCPDCGNPMIHGIYGPACPHCGHTEIF